MISPIRKSRTTSIEKFVIGTIITSALVIILTVATQAMAIVLAFKYVSKHGIKSIVERVWEGSEKKAEEN